MQWQLGSDYVNPKYIRLTRMEQINIRYRKQKNSTWTVSVVLTVMHVFCLRATVAPLSEQFVSELCESSLPAYLNLLDYI